MIASPSPGDARVSTDVEIDRLLLRDMHHVGGGLFLTGGLLIVAVLAVSSWPEMNRAMLLVTTAVAIAAAGVLLGLPERLRLPRRVFPLLCLLGTANITATLIASGPEGAAPFSVLYAFVSMFSFYYLRAPMAAAQVLLAAAANAAALQVVGTPNAVAHWIVVTGGIAAVGALVGRAGRRHTDLLLAEHAAVAKLQELDHLRTTFLRAVSHELRTPLTGVVGYIETLRARQGTLTPEQTTEMLDGVGRNATRLDVLLTNLLDIDRISRGVIAPLRGQTDLGELVATVVAETTTPRHQVDVVIQGDVVIRVEASKIERIVENLVGNATKHTPPGTRILVTVAGHDAAVEVTVEDDGPGLQGVDEISAFQPFAQGHDSAHSPSPGTGIGLSLVSRFAELHGGSVDVRRGELGGASFVVRLPRVEEEADAQVAVRVSDGAPATRP